MRLCESQNNQRLFPYTELTDCYLQTRECVYCAVGTVFVDRFMSLLKGPFRRTGG